MQVFFKKLLLIFGLWALGTIGFSSANTPITPPNVSVEAPKSERFFTCWAYLKNKETGDTAFVQDQVIGDFGGEFNIEFEGKTYRIKLSQLQYNETLPVLKLGVHLGDNTKTIYYLWSDPSAKLIGVNLGWMQVGCKIV